MTIETTPHSDPAIDLARRRGWLAYRNGRSYRDCPYDDAGMSAEWKLGFDEAAVRSRQWPVSDPQDYDADALPYKLHTDEGTALAPRRGPRKVWPG